MLFVQQVSLEHSTIPGDEAAPCVLRYLLGSAGVVQDDLRKHAVRPAAYPEIQVVLDLAGDDVGVGPLGGKYQMDTKSPPQSRNLCSDLSFLLKISYKKHKDGRKTPVLVFLRCCWKPISLN